MTYIHTYLILKSLKHVKRDIGFFDSQMNIGNKFFMKINVKLPQKTISCKSTKNIGKHQLKRSHEFHVS